MTDYNVLKKLAAQELARANEKYPAFHSLHEGYAVLLEELEELREDVQQAALFKECIWQMVRCNDNKRALEFAGRIRDTAIHAAAEALQVAAMAQKLIDMGGTHHD